MQIHESHRQYDLPTHIVVVRGITEKQIEELLTYSSSDEQVIAQTSDPKRFKNRAAYDEWLKKERSIYTLSHKDGSLLGIIWYGTQAIPRDKDFTIELNHEDFGITFAIRLYRNARGQKLSNPFMKSAWEKYSTSEDYEKQTAKGVWLETSNDNLSAVNTYRRFGYQHVSNPDEHNRILMILPISTS